MGDREQKLGVKKIKIRFQCLTFACSVLCVSECAPKEPIKWPAMVEQTGSGFKFSLLWMKEDFPSMCPVQLCVRVCLGEEERVTFWTTYCSSR